MAGSDRECTRDRLLHALARHRGALGVLGFHSVAALVDRSRNWLVAVLSHGRLGVFIFFC